MNCRRRKRGDARNRMVFLTGKEYVMFSFLAFSLGLILPFHLMAQDVSIRASFSKDTILIGDQLNFTLKVVQPQDIKVRIPAFRDSITSGIEVLKQLRNDTLHRKNNTLEITRQYRVTSFDTGSIIVNPIEIAYTRNGLKATLETPSLELFVKTLPVDVSKGIRDIKKPYNVPLTFREVFRWILAALILAGAVYLIVLYVRKRKKKVTVTPVRKKPKEQAHVIALRELNELKEARLWQQGRVKLYYTRLTDTLRTYLENRYDIRAMEQITGEILQSLKEIGFNDNKLYGILQNILETADMVKFAKYKPLPDVNESSLLDAYVFVNETKEAWKKETGQTGTDKPNIENQDETEVVEEIPVAFSGTDKKGKEDEDHA